MKPQPPVPLDMRYFAYWPYVGKACTLCGDIWKTVDQLLEDDPIVTQENPLGFACRKCWESKRAT